MNSRFKIKVEDVEQTQQKYLKWAQSFSTCAFFNSNNYPDYPYSKFEAILAVGVKEEIKPKDQSWIALQKKLNECPNWWFGYLGYDLKNEIEHLSSKNSDIIGFDDMYFFQPEYILQFHKDEIEVLAQDNLTREEFESRIEEYQTTIKSKSIELQAKVTKNQYLEKLNSIKEHIRKGDIYEVNFCQEFYSENATIDPVQSYWDLNKISKSPFSSFLKIKDKFLLSSTPERFLKRTGNKIISQPIKGTAKRGKNKREDQEIKKNLQNSLKDTTENIMIVDLVRNDLSRTSIPGSVKVEELHKLYTFKQVHQLISTVSSQVKEQTHSIEIIKNAFPMGSMTGAPKVKAMEIIEKYESTKRGIFSGALGYFSPDGNFDFNVVIRSIMYNKSTKTLSIQVGGAITHDSDPELEYEECLLKAKAMIEVLSKQK